MRLLADILRYLDRDRFLPRILILDQRTDVASEFPGDVPVDFLGRGGRPSKLQAIGVFSKIYREARRSDLVISWTDFWLGYTTVAAARLALRPVVAWIQNDIEAILASGAMTPWIHSMLHRRVIGQADAIVSISHGLTDSLKRCFGLANVSTIQNGIDCEKVLSLSASLVSPPSSPYVINVAGFSKSKNQSLLIKAHKLLLDKGMSLDLVFCGEGELLQSCQREAQELHTADRCHFLGFQPNPYPWIRNASAFVLTSRWEPYGLVLAEALCLGTPVISTDCGAGPREILDNGDAGLITPNEDAVSLAGAVERILSEPQTVQKLRTQGEEAAKRHDIRGRVCQIENLFDSVLKARRKD